MLNDIEALSFLNTFLSSVDGFGLFIALIALIVTALYSYKLFRLEMTLAGLISGFYIGANFVPIIFSMSADELQNAVYLPNLFGIICAFGFAALIHAIFKLAIFIAGAGIGAGIAICALPLIDGIDFLDTDVGFWVSVAVIALLAGIIMLFIFKPVYIVASALSSGLGAGVIINSMLMPENETLEIVILASGLALGIVGIIFQFRSNKK